jgi:glutamine amidotransferase
VNDVVVVDYGIGNLRSAQKAFEAIGVAATLTGDRDVIGRASAVVLPGVGAFGRCADALDEAGLTEVLRDVIAAKTPFLGICVGFQLLYEASEESPGSRGLGVFHGTVRRLSNEVKVPQMQWNQLHIRGETTPMLLRGLPENPWVYFVHSYAPEVSAETIATCEYGGTVAALAQREATVGAQFHPEKSGPLGLSILENFISCASGMAPWS